MYRNSKQTILFPLLLAAGVVAGLLLGQYLGRNTTASQLKGVLDRMTLPTNKLTYTLSLIENEYVDSVSMDSLSEHVIPLLVRELDPHSVYIPASEMAELNEPLEGEFDGIGVVFNMATDTVIVLNVIPQGPSDKAGVKAGDRIIEIDDSLVAGRRIPQNRIVKLLRGPRGSKVHLGLERQGISDLVRVVVERGVIPIKSVESAFRIADSIGYIKLGQFARTTHEEIRQSLTKLREDLRGRVREETKQLFVCEAEISNLDLIFRAKAFFPHSLTPERIRALLVPVWGILTQRQMEALADTETPDEFLQRYNASRAAVYYGSRSATDSLSADVRGQSRLYATAERLLRFSNAPQPVLAAVLCLADLERSNIFNVVEGVRYGLPPEKIAVFLKNGKKV